MNIQTAYNNFILEQRFRRNSPETISYYRISLQKFFDYTGDINIDELTLELYKTYTLYLLETDLKSTSVHTYLRAVKAFYNYLINEDLIPDCSRKLKLVKQDKKVIVPLSDVEIDKLLDCFNCSDVLDLRNKCIVVLMLDSGLRLGEVIRLQLDDIFDNFIVVNGKGGKQRVVPLGQNCKRLLSTYINHFRLGAASSARVFISKYEEKPVTPNAIHCFFEDLKIRSGITRLYPHLLRHTFATMYIIDGGNLETLRVILGHSTIAITQIYLHLATNYKLAYQKHKSHLDIMRSDFNEKE